MRKKYIIFLCLFGLVLSRTAIAQQVGVVLSGGGASGLAHIGVLKAIEEAEIPIDYITGTSAGALIGSLYAAGYSPDEIEAYIRSENFIKMSTGKSTEEQRFLLHEKEKDASMLNINFAKDSIFKKSLPTNFFKPAFLDYEMLRLIGHVGAAVDGKFDSLFVPFRCVASDIQKKESVVFSDGNLNAAVRASMTYPFYLNPIRIDGHLYFDGGLYNNFPADVMYHEFPVDYIIGSNVSYNSAPPSEDDVISQITNMLVRSTDFTLPCEAGIIIEPTSEIGTFEFDKADLAIQSGYVAAQEYIDSIRQFVTKRVTKKEVKERRERFRKKIKPLQINTIQTETLDGEEVNYVNRSFMQDSLSQPLSFDEFSKRYFRSYSSNQIKYIFPTLNKSSDSTYALKLKVYPEKPFELSVGGHFSSRPVNTAYIGLSYLDIGKGAVDLHAESYFGKFYGSTKVNLNYDFPSVYSFRATPYFVLNRWDYYRSSSTFFEDTKPSFLVQNEMYYGLKFGIPSSNNAKIELDVRKFQNEDTYYQTLNFSNKDTADITRFNGESARIDFKLNRLNRKQWASEGASLKASIRYVQGKEKSLAGNTTEIDYDLRKFHRWINASLEGQKYFEMSPFFKLGIYGKAVLNSQSLFSNYTATVLTMTEFSPLPDSRPLFMAEYRAPQFIGGGMNFIFTYNDLFDLRIDPYFFQPFRQIVRYDDGDFGYSNLLKEGTPMVGASLIFHSPIGPLRVSTNFFPKQDQQFVTQLSFGYIIFNDRAIR